MSLFLRNFRVLRAVPGSTKRSLVRSAHVRTLSTTLPNDRSANVQPEQKIEFSQAITEAGKLVGYQSDFSTLRWLFKDDILNFELHLKKLIETNHPLLETVK